MYTRITQTVLILTIIFMRQNILMAQTAKGQLDNYISIAFTENEGLKQQQFNLDKSLLALKEAKAMYLPSVSMLGSYTKAAGGRTIDVSLGDLLNPVYSSLNKLTSSNSFPQLSNESFLLNADNFYDLKLRTSLPLINAEIHYNKLIKQQLISSQQAAVNVYKRALVKDIKTAYYQYYQSLQAIAVYQNALVLIKENIRVNNSMLKNGLRNGTALLRSQTEEQKTKASLFQAQRNSQNARAYFNFLLNRPLKDTVIVEQQQLAASLAEPDTSAGTTAREELKQLQTMQQVYALDYQRQKSGFIPKLNTFIDLGSQATDFAVNSKSRYYLWGVNLQWDIFTGGQRKYRSAQSRISMNSAAAKLDETQQALQLQLDQSYNNFQSSRATYKSMAAQLAFATRYYNDQLKAYKAGELLYLELVDAENQLTGTKLQLAEAEANLLITLAELERNQAAYPMDK